MYTPEHCMASAQQVDRDSRAEDAKASADGMIRSRVNDQNTPVLVCNGLHFCSGRSLFALPDFQVASGERVFVYDPSSRDKSILPSLISGIKRPIKGRVDALGQSLSKLGPSECDRFRADHIGYVFEKFNLLPYLGVIENVLLSCIFSTRRTQRASAVYPTRTEAIRLLLALGLDAELLKRRTADALSLNQQQCVAAARAVIGGPELIIASGPISMLDAKAGETFVSLFLAECRRYRSSVVFISHERSLMHHFDRTVQIVPGMQPK